MPPAKASRESSGEATGHTSLPCMYTAFYRSRHLQLTGGIYSGQDKTDHSSGRGYSTMLYERDLPYRCGDGKNPREDEKEEQGAGKEGFSHYFEG